MQTVKDRAPNSATARCCQQACALDVYSTIYSIICPVSVCFAQGALYCLLGVHSNVCLASSRDWECVGEVWPALVRCGLSPTMTLEELSIGRLLDEITDRIHRQHDTIGIYFTVSNMFSSSQYPTLILTFLLIAPLCSLPLQGI